jgi:copper chaperone CopZ
MRSVHSSRAVMTALNTVAGILRADVSIGRATIEHDGRATPDALRAAVELAGYQVAAVEEHRRRLPIA